MIKHAALVTVVATAGLLYTALTRETDLAEFDRKELEALIESQRPALALNSLVEDRRQQFARLMMDYAEHENERLQAARAFIPGIIERQTKTIERDPALALLVTHFEIDPHTSLDHIEAELYLRVDGLPPALVATQAAIESAWGESRFALKGNNFFGHQCYEQGCGIKPRNSKKKSLEVRRFETIGDSVAAYYQNINTHRAYRDLRQLRLDLRTQNQPLTTKELIPTLSRYSELGKKYLSILRSVFRSDYIQLAQQVEPYAGQ
jgi:Bax protein